MTFQNMTKPVFTYDCSLFLQSFSVHINKNRDSFTNILVVIIRHNQCVPVQLLILLLRITKSSQYYECVNVHLQALE